MKREAVRRVMKMKFERRKEDVVEYD